MTVSPFAAMELVIPSATSTNVVFAQATVIGVDVTTGLYVADNENVPRPSRAMIYSLTPSRRELKKPH
jgi:hypothetical protein